jgi:hypothetical protein
MVLYLLWAIATVIQNYGDRHSPRYNCLGDRPHTTNTQGDRHAQAKSWEGRSLSNHYITKLTYSKLRRLKKCFEFTYHWLEVAFY